MRDGRLILALLILFAGSFFVLTHPVWLDWGYRVIGHPDSDIWKHLWGDVWFLRSFGETFPVPLSTRLIGFPDGGLLYNLDPITGIAVWALGQHLGVAVVHNLSLGINVIAGAMGAFLLARRLTGDGAASAVAGAIYGFAAQIQCLALASGIGETIHIAYIPLSLLAILHVLEERSWWATLWGGLCLALSALGSWYYGLMTGFFAITLCFGYAYGAGWIVSRGYRPGFRPVALLPIAQLTFMAAIALLLVYPFAQSFTQSIGDSNALNNIAQQGVKRGAKDLLPLYNGSVVSLVDLIIPREPRINYVRDLLIFSNHPGLIALILSAFALLRGGALVRLLSVVALLSVAVGFGPIFHLDRTTALFPNPVFLLLEVLPVFGMVRNLERFQVPFTLCLGVLSALGLSSLFNLMKLKGGWRQGAGVAIALLCIVDASYVSGLTFPIPSSELKMAPIHRQLGKAEGRFAVIELPLTDRPGGRAFWHQIAHGRPLPVNLEGNIAPSLKENSLMREMIARDSLNFYLQGEPHQLPSTATLESGRLALRQAGFKFVILNQSVDPKEMEEELRVRDLLWETLGPPIKANIEWGYEVYVIDPSYRRSL